MKATEIVGSFTALDAAGNAYEIRVLQQFVALPRAAADRGPAEYRKALQSLVTDRGERVSTVANQCRMYVLRRGRDILLTSDDPAAP